MATKKEAARATTPEAAGNSDGNKIIHQDSRRRQYFRDGFGRFLTVLIAAAEAVGYVRMVDLLLARKARLLRRRCL